MCQQVFQSRHSAAPNGRKTLPECRGFTLVELLIVLGIIALLILLLLPAVQAARETARRTQCANKFRQSGIALHNFYDAQKHFPPGLVLWSSGSPASCGPRPTRGVFYGFGWGAYILPYLEEEHLYRAINFNRDFFDASSGNRRAIGTLLPTFLCPSDPQGAELVFCCSGWTNGASPFENVGNTNMAGVADTIDVTCDGTWPKHLTVATGAMAEHRGATVGMITDGLSKTFMLGEVTGAGPKTYFGNYWASWNIKSTVLGINDATTIPGGGHWQGYLHSGFSSFHPRGCNFMLADGSVRFFSETIDRVLLLALTTRAGGEDMPPP